MQYYIDAVNKFSGVTVIFSTELDQSIYRNIYTSAVK
jgi:hypothetical protein